LGFSIIHSKTPLASRFLDAKTNKIGNIKITAPKTAYSILPIPISVNVKAK